MTKFPLSKDRASVILWVVLISATISLAFFIIAKTGSRVGPPYQEITGSGGGSSIAGQNDTIEIVATLSAVNAGIGILGVDSGSGVLTLDSITPTPIPAVPTATPIPAVPTATPELSDQFLLNTGDIGTGNYDFGGAVDFELPNGGGCASVNNPGEIKIDTTAEGICYEVDSPTFSFIEYPYFYITYTQPNPTATEDDTVFFVNRPGIITDESCVLIGSSTPSVTITLRHSASDRTAAGQELNTGGRTITSVTTASIDTSFNDPSFNSNSFMWVETTAQSGTVTEIHCSWKMYYDF